MFDNEVLNSWKVTRYNGESRKKFTIQLDNTPKFIMGKGNMYEHVPPVRQGKTKKIAI
jgi:hypothetical protein